jgi:hypothetical protein
MAYTFSQKMTEDEIDESDYGQVGWYHVTEVKRLFEALKAEGIRFYFETQETGITGLDPVSANFGGSFGQGAQVLVYVHLEDQSKFNQAYQKKFEPEEEEKIDWRKNLRGG